MHGEAAFGSSFQRSLIRACLDDPGLRALLLRFTQTGQLGFTDPPSAWAWEALSKHEAPTALILSTEAARLSDEVARAGVQAILAATTDWRESDYIRGQIVEWTRKQLFRAGFESARGKWNEGDVEGARTLMMGKIEEMAQIQLESADRGWFFEDFGERQERRAFAASGNDYFPSGIERIDRAMNGGLHYGELESVMSYSGIGKTFWCVHRGFIGARMRRRVLHFVLEGGRGKTEDRYEARWADTIYRETRVGQFTSEVLHRLHLEYQSMREGLVIRGFSDRKTEWRVTYDDILAEIDELRRTKGWRPDLIVVDYGDLVWSPGDDERTKQKESFRKLKTLAEKIEGPGHHGYAVCAPSQAVRPTAGADTKEHVLKPRDIADCYEKIRICDVIISLNRTLDEKGDEEARVFLGKYRDDEDGVLVKVKTNYPKGTFCEIGLEIPMKEPSGGDD